MSLTLTKVNLAAPLITLLTGAIIRSKANGDKAKIVARAQELETILGAFQKINTGDSSGILDLEAAVANLDTLDPSEALAVNQLAALVATKVSIATEVAGNTIMGQLASEAMDAVAAVMVQTCQAFVTKYGTPAVAPTIPIAPATA